MKQSRRLDGILEYDHIQRSGRVEEPTKERKKEWLGWGRRKTRRVCCHEQLESKVPQVGELAMLKLAEGQVQGRHWFGRTEPQLTLRRDSMQWWDWSKPDWSGMKLGQEVRKWA